MGESLAGMDADVVTGLRFYISSTRPEEHPKSYPRAIISWGKETIAAKVGYETAIIASAAGSDVEAPVLDLRRRSCSCVCRYQLWHSSAVEDRWPHAVAIRFMNR
jgi:hypothetical protein